MNRLPLLKPLALLVLSLSVSGCLYDTAGNSTERAPDAQLTPAVTAETPTTSADKAAEPVRTANGGPLGGYIEQFMDANDKSKMARALDGALGKAASWSNPVSGANFAVTPVRKVSLGSGICRAYLITMNKSGVVDKVNGTACIGDDGVWHVSG